MRPARLGLAVVMLLILACLPSLLAACRPSAPPATPTPTRTPRVEKVAAVPTASSTPVLMASPTPQPSPTETATSGPTATATPDPRIIDPAKDKTVSFLTGLRPSNSAVLDRRPLAIKVANYFNVRPQSGLEQADVVVESRVEFELTRFTALYQSQDAKRIGSVRSARLIDVELPAIFDAILAFSGGVEPVRQKLYASDFSDHILEAGSHFDGYYRDPSIAAPDNLFADSELLWKNTTKLGWNKRPQPRAGWVFSEKAPDGGKPASQIDVTYPMDVVTWKYDPATGRWGRSANGKTWVEATDGKQITASDVVVLGANHVQTLILEFGTEDNMGGRNRSVEIQLWGEGPAKILRDGKVYEGKWVRPNRQTPFRFVDTAGNDIPLKPGNSWWQVVPLDAKVTVKP
jgi:hypothetical protein